MAKRLDTRSIMTARTQPIRADQYWNDTGVDLVGKTRYRLAVVPTLGEPLRDASFAASSIAGEEWDSVPHKTAELFRGKRMDDAKWFALIGTVAQKHPWVITDGGIIAPPASGRLVCFFNDVQMETFYKNNSGWVVLDVEMLED